MTPEELSDLAGRAQLVHDLAKTEGWALLTDYVSAWLEPKQRALLGGAIEDMLRYKFEAGHVQGALSVLAAPERIQTELARARELMLEEKRSAA